MAFLLTHSRRFGKLLEMIVCYEMINPSVAKVEDGADAGLQG
jgi:hypothetical protein